MIQGEIDFVGDAGLKSIVRALVNVIGCIKSASLTVKTREAASYFEAPRDISMESMDHRSRPVSPALIGLGRQIKPGDCQALPLLESTLAIVADSFLPNFQLRSVHCLGWRPGSSSSVVTIGVAGIRSFDVETGVKELCRG